MKTHCLKIFYLLLLLASPLMVMGTVHEGKANTNFRFEENKNQWEKQIRYKAQLGNGSLFLENNSFTYMFLNENDLQKLYHLKHEGGKKGEDLQNFSVNAHAFKVNFIGSNLHPVISSSRPFADYKNYFIGNNPSKWASNVLSYQELIYSELYPDIDMKLYGLGDHLKYDFIVKPGAKAQSINIAYDGADKLFIKNGNLHIATSVNEVIEQKPYAYQIIDGKEVEVACFFLLNNNVLSFDFPGGYDSSIPLIIDPVLTFSSYSGSGSDNWGYTSTYDNNGNLYGAGIVFGNAYPTTVGAYQVGFGGGFSTWPTDVAISKFSSNGTALIYSTYLGGSGNELPHSLIVNDDDELLIYGTTGSSDFPVTATAYDTSFNGGSAVTVTYVVQFPNGSDIFLTKLDSTGGSLLGSTYVGGTGNDGLNLATNLHYNYGDHARGEIITDSAHNVYVASCTQSVDFPTTPGAFQAASGGGQDGVTLKLSSDLSSLTWSSYLGGSGDDAAYSLKLDNSGNMFACGGTNSSNFPGTAGGLNPTYQGGIADGYVAKINAGGTGLFNATYLGTSQYDQCYFIEVGVTDEIYLVGQTLGAYPVTPGTFSSTGSQFIQKLNNGLNTTIFTTRFGSGTTAVNISPTAFLVDICSNIYVSGWGGGVNSGFNPSTGNTNNMPLTIDAYQSTTDGSDLYFIIFDPNATALVYASYFGGNGSAEHQDGGTSRFDENGVIYQAACAGCGGTSLYPTTPGAWSTTNNSGNCNLGVLKLDFQVAIINAQASAAPSDTGCAPHTVNFLNSSSSSFSYSWDFNDGSPLDSMSNPTHTFLNPGSYNVQLIATGNGCGLSDTFYLPVTVLPEPIVDLGSDSLLCPGNSLLLDAGNPGNSYLWSTGDSVQAISINSAGTYWVAVDNGFCVRADTINITYTAFLPLGNDTSLCGGVNVILNAANPGAAYLWSTGDTTAAITVSVSNDYWVTETLGYCSQTDTIAVFFYPVPVVLLGNDTLLCPSDSILLDAGNPGGTYQWSTGDTGQVIMVNSSGVFSVTVSNGNCTNSDTISIAVMPPFVPLGNDTLLCDGLTVTLNTANPGASYLWSTGATTDTIVVATSGDYWATETIGNCSRTDTVNVTFNPVPLVNLGNDTLLCPEESVVLDAGNPGNTYLWSTGDTVQFSSADVSGIYSVIVNNGYCTGTDTIVISIMLPFLPLPNDTTLCGGLSLTVFAANPGATYAWSTGVTTDSIVVSTPGSYWVTETIGNCNKTDTIEVVFDAVPVVFLGNDTLLCPGDSIILDAGNNGSSYLWSTGEITQTITAAVSNNFFVTVDNGNCETTDSINVTIQVLTPLLNDTIMCDGHSLQLDAGNPGGTYLWSTGATTQTINVVVGGSYWVTKNVGNCSLTDTTNVTYQPSPMVYLGPDTVLCPGQVVSLDAGTSGNAYLWTTGENTQVINVSNSGDYGVTVFLGNCARVDTVNVKSTPAPSIGEDIFVCDENEVFLNAEDTSGATYLWSTGETSSGIMVNDTGKYWVEITIGNCTSVDTLEVSGVMGNSALYFPNTFTPNNDGLNENFSGFGHGILSFDMKIFNRWGELIYVTSDMDKGWDGTYMGNLVKMDIYIWMVEYRLICNERKAIRKVGHVFLSR